jgi:microcystin degradation protein MlrC
MVAQGADDAEGALLARLRQRLGPDVPIFATLDLHANVSDAMARHANGLISYRTYPHIDHHERATQAAELMHRTLAGKIKPSCLVARRPTISGCNHGRTQSGPMAEFLKQADAFETENGILVVSVQAGFGWADMADCGPSVAVTYDGDKARAQHIADDLMDQVWQTRQVDTLPQATLADAMTEARQGGPKPLILADTTDNPGGGGYNDATGLLRAMLDAKLENACFHAICDPEAIAVITKAGAGADIRVKLGGKIDPAFGAPIDLSARVMSLSDGKFVADGPMNKGVAFNHGPSAVLRAGGIDIVVVTNRLQTADLHALLSVGIDPRAKATIGLKSSHHFRAAYEPIARKVMVVDSGALCSHDLTRFNFTKVRRPVWPLDEIA